MLNTVLKHALTVAATLVLVTLGQVNAQDNPFSGMERFDLLGYETLVDPSNEFGEVTETSVDEIEPDGTGYRFYIAEGSDPGVLYEDVCPAGYEATWYTFDAESDSSVSIGFFADVEPIPSDKSAWFSPIFADSYRERADNPTFTAPVYVAFCGYSDTRGEFRRNHNIFVRNESDSATEVECQILVNNSGNQEVISSATSDASVAYCFGRR